MNHLRYAAVALLASAATPALAQEAQTARFNITGVDIALPVPAGYCLPEGKRAAVAQLLAASDDTNVTDLTLNRCEDDRAFADYYLVKTPKAMLAVTVTRAQLIDLMVKTIDDPALKAALDPAKIGPEVEKSLERVIGQKTTIGGEVKWLGHDDVCVYLGGVISLKRANADYKRALSGCLTAVSGRALTIYRYSDGTDPANVTRNLADAKALALSMKGSAAN